MPKEKSQNSNLHQAKETKNDEFYTQLSDIQAELSHYTDKFQGKVVFCNCDDPFESNFVKYFLMNFNRLGLKELIATGYRSNSIDCSEIGEPHTPYALRVKDTSKYLVETQKDLDVKGVKYFLETEEKIMSPLIGNNALDESGQQIQISVKKELIDADGNPVLDKKGKPKTKTFKKDLYYEAGDFRSNMSLALLNEADIIVTNPPFSLLREYVVLLMKYNKHFLIIANSNAITYKEVFPLLKNNVIWLGNNWVKQFKQPDGNIKQFGNVLWLTNLDHKKRHQKLPLDLGFVYKGHEDMYPKYDNYDAINVNKVSEIPCDYEPCWYKCPHATNCQYASTEGKGNNALCEMMQSCKDADNKQTNDCSNENHKCNGVIGVPISFLDKHCPEQFEIIGADEAEGTGFSNGLFISKSKYKQCYTSNKRIYKRIFIKKKY